MDDLTRRRDEIAVRMIKVEPIGEREASGFVTMHDGCGPRTWIEKVYPPSSNGEALRLIRRATDRGLRETAALLGLQPSDVNALEFGRATLSDEDWRRAFALLAKNEGKGGVDR